MNANDIISQALKLCGVLGTGQTMRPGDAADGFFALNTMLDRWRAERLTMYQVAPNTFNLTALTATYTIGPTGTWVITPVPTWIENASVVDNTPATPFEMPMEIATPQRWALLVSQKTLQATFPFALYYQRAGGTGLINVWPVPTVGSPTYQIRLYLAVPLAQFADRTTDVSLPAGYGEALIYQLARRLAPTFGRVLDPMVIQIGDDALATVKRTNENMDELAVDDALVNNGGRGWNYYTGDWTR